MPLRVATLTRRSTDDQHQPFTIQAQDSKLAAYIQSQDDWRLIENCRYTDDMSGATLDRPASSAPWQTPARTATTSCWSTASTASPAPSAACWRSSTSSTRPA